MLVLVHISVFLSFLPSTRVLLTPLFSHFPLPFLDLFVGKNFRVPLLAIFQGEGVLKRGDNIAVGRRLDGVETLQIVLVSGMRKAGGVEPAGRFRILATALHLPTNLKTVTLDGRTGPEHNSRIDKNTNLLKKKR